MTLNTGSRLDLTSERYHNFVDAIAGKKSLKKFHLYVNGECNLIEGIADGITRNKFVEHVEWNFPHTGLLTESAMTALCQMIQNCPSLRFLSFRIISQSVFPNREEDDEDPPPSSTKASTSYDQMASRFFTAFMTSRNVRSFSFYIPASAKGLSDDNKETALQAMQVNGNLKRIIARFQNADYRLNMLKTDKRYHWTERWNDLNATDLERVQVMEEILAVSDLDQVTVLFHFLREQPEILPVYYE